MPTEVVVPSAFLRTDAAYRTYGTDAVRIGCGFWLARSGADEVGVAYPFFALAWVLRGAAEYADRVGSRWTVRPGDAYLRLPGRRHTTRYPDPRYAECWIDLGGGLAGFPEAAGLVARDRPVLAPGIDLSLLRRCDEVLAALRRAPESALPLIAADLVALVVEVVRLDRRASGDPHAALVDEACRQLERGPSPRWALARLARRHGIAYERFRKVFAARVGCAPGAYAVRRRLDRARDLLLSGGRTVEEVAAELGYASAASFSLLFRRHIGQAPGRFRDHRR